MKLLKPFPEKIALVPRNMDEFKKILDIFETVG